MGYLQNCKFHIYIYIILDNMYLCIYIYPYIHISIYTYIHTYIYIYISLNIYIYTDIQICIYIYTHVYIIWMNISIIFYIIIWNLKHHREDNRPIVWMKKMEMSWNSGHIFFSNQPFWFLILILFLYQTTKNNMFFNTRFMCFRGMVSG